MPAHGWAARSGLREIHGAGSDPLAPQPPGSNVALPIGSEGDAWRGTGACSLWNRSSA